MTDLEKATKTREVLARFAAEQPARNDAWVWAMEALNFPPVALAMLYDAFHQEGGE